MQCSFDKKPYEKFRLSVPILLLIIISSTNVGNTLENHNFENAGDVV